MDDEEISSCESPSVYTWPGIANIFVSYVELETETAAKSKKGLSDSEIGKVFRNLIKAADNDQRSGERIFRHYTLSLRPFSLSCRHYSLSFMHYYLSFAPSMHECLLINT